MIQHDVSPALAYASRRTLVRRRRLVGFLLVGAGGIVLTCIALSLLPGLTACTLLIRCGTWYPLIPLGMLFVVVGMTLAPSHAVPLTDEEALSVQLYSEILAEYARGRMILKILVSMLLLLGGASALFAPSHPWALLVVGSLGVLLGLGVLVHACLRPREERHSAAAHERERHSFHLD